MTGLVLPQPGILALGTTAQTYLELDLVPPAPSGAGLLAAVAQISGGLMTGQGCNVVVGFRPDLWQRIKPGTVPDDVHGFDEPLTGPDGFAMPATQHDLLVWVAAGARDVVFDEAMRAVRTLGPLATVADETTGWTYHHHLDLTGFVDGTENPPMGAASEYALVASGPGAGGSVLLLQRWDHDALAWESLGAPGQERVMGRTKGTNEEIEDKSPTSHIARNDQDEVGQILRRNIAYGDLRDHGTLFVGLCGRQAILHEMLRRMVGADGGGRDDLTRYTTPVTGAYYFLPAATDLPSPPEDDD
jgi:putative iron-dependent peroxidase